MTYDLNGLLRLTQDRIRPAAEMAARAFHDNPLSVYFAPDDSKRLKNQIATFGGLLRRGLLYGEVYATSRNMEGLALWLPPDYQPVPPRLSFLARIWMSMFADKEMLKRQRAFEEYAGEVRKRVVPGRHWYLQLLAVDPALQGRGYSSRLLKPMLVRADRDGLPCYLETQAEKNVALYEHFGFRVAVEEDIPGSNIHSWALVRGK